MDAENRGMEGTSAIAAALDMVGPRRRVRAQRGSTPDRGLGADRHVQEHAVEAGERPAAPSLSCCRWHRPTVPIDDLVGAPEVGDPRIRLKPRRVHGRTVLPLTRPGGIQAWKIVIPTSQYEPNPRTHEGFEWLYVLSGRMRLVLGDQDLVLGVGEAAEFDTQVPHWFGSTGDGPAEVLSIFDVQANGCTCMSSNRTQRQHPRAGASSRLPMKQRSGDAAAGLLYAGAVDSDAAGGASMADPLVETKRLCRGRDARPSHDRAWPPSRPGHRRLRHRGLGAGWFGKTTLISTWLTA